MRKLRAGLEQVYGIAEAQCEFQGRIRVVQAMRHIFAIRIYKSSARP